MKTSGQNRKRLQVLQKNGMLLAKIAGLLLLLNLVSGFARAAACRHNPPADTSLSANIEFMLLKGTAEQLCFPASVKRFYQETGYQPVWLKQERNHVRTWQAMLLLDCVLQFGLSHEDYHPDKLRYNTLHQIFEEPAKVAKPEQARFEILLTDALLALINHLHYGKLNPVYTSQTIDQAGLPGMRAEAVLAQALLHGDFMSWVLDTQPKCREYAELQEMMRLMKGQYVGDCYEVPEEVIRKIAINMERLRWVGLDDSIYVQVNIPSATLKVQHLDTAYYFKTIVGTAAAPTPVFNSQIDYLIAAPDRRLNAKAFKSDILPYLDDSTFLEKHQYTIYDQQGYYLSPTSPNLALVKAAPEKYVVRQSGGCDQAMGAVAFHIAGQQDLYLHDQPDQALFGKRVRTFNTQGGISVEEATNVAALLLVLDKSNEQLTRLDNAIAKDRRQQFSLKKPISLKVTYLTCEMVNAYLVIYPDVYGYDRPLESALYNHKGLLAKNK